MFAPPVEITSEQLPENPFKDMLDNSLLFQEILDKEGNFHDFIQTIRGMTREPSNVTAAKQRPMSFTKDN